MAEWGIFMTLAATLALIAAVGTGVADAQSVPAECERAIARLVPCIPYVSGEANPSQSCCNALDSEVKSDPICLCHILTSNEFNQTLALALPQACRVSTPPVSECNSIAKAPTSPPPGVRRDFNGGRVWGPSMILSILTVGVALMKALR